MEVKIELTGQVMTAYLSGEMTITGIRPVREEIDRFAEVLSQNCYCWILPMLLLWIPVELA